MKICNANFVIAVVALYLSSAGLVDAMTYPMGHEMSGIVQQVSRTTITILPEGESKPVVFAWKAKETEFIRNGVLTTPRALPVGTKVQIRCGHPIFGRSSLYRLAPARRS
jgi:hypothetical protein